MKNRLLLSLLAILGFSGCSDGDDIIDTPDMYGVPMADFLFKGELQDAEGNPIQGVDVEIKYYESMTSEADGSFSSTFAGWPINDYTMIFTDVDGEENGGEFQTKEIELPFEDAVESDDQYLFDLGTVVLEPKEE